MRKKVIALLFIAGCFGGHAQWNEISKEVASDREMQAFYGEEVDIDGNYAIVGAPREDKDETGGNLLSDAGAAYILVKDASGNWSETQKLVPSDRIAYGYFGIGVALDGDYAAILGNSSVYVFKRGLNNTWNQVQKISANPTTAVNFGRDIDISGNFIVASGRYNGPILAGTYPGAAYVFENINNNWTEVQRILPSDGDQPFGQSVSISGGTIAIGDPDGGNPPFTDVSQALTNPGVVYVYEYNNGWPQYETQRIEASDGSGFDKFGFSIAIDAEEMIISTRYDAEDENGANALTYAGSAYIFRKENGSWVEKQKIVASDREMWDGFGHTVSISGNYLVVGAIQEDDNVQGVQNIQNAGSAYIFEKDATGVWSEMQKIVASDRQENAQFANVGISGYNIIVGAPGQMSGNTNPPNDLPYAGAAYLFEFDPCAHTNNALNHRIQELEEEITQLKTQLAEDVYIRDQQNILVTPNPATSGAFSVEITGVSETGSSEIELYNANGQLIESRQNVEQVSHFDIHDQAKGVYILKYYNNGSTTVTKIIYQ